MEHVTEVDLSCERSRAVAVTMCDTYEMGAVREALDRVLGDIGGMRAFVKPGQRVLLKPNLLSAKDPARAITTHPSIVEAAVEQVRKAGGLPFVGDSPGGIIRGIRRVWANTGMEEMARRTGVELVNFEAAGSKGIPFGRYTFYIAKPVLEADVIINLAKLKTHSLTLLTCAIKNMFGVIPGFRKGELHKMYPKPEAFADMLVHLYKLVTPSLSIVDAVVAMEGNGPSSGKPHKLGLVIAGEDAVSIDTVAAHIVGFQDDFIDTTRIAAAMGLGEGRREKIRLVGSGMDVKPAEFELPSNRVLRLIPKPVTKLIAPLVWVKPVIDAATCTGCAFCFENCPVGAIGKDGAVYVVDDRKCIKCMCCHELCPESSVAIRLSWLARFFA